MLERVEPEVGQARDVAAGCEYAEDPALIARAIAIGNVEARVGHVLWRYLNLWRSRGRRAGPQPANVRVAAGTARPARFTAPKCGDLQGRRGSPKGLLLGLLPAALLEQRDREWLRVGHACRG